MGSLRKFFLQQELKEGIIENSIKKVEHSLNRGADIEHEYGKKRKHQHPYTPLILAIKQGNMDIINLLLKNNVNVNHVIMKSIRFGISPLTAVFSCHHENQIEIYKQLLIAGAKFHKFKYKPSHRHYLGSEIEIVNELEMKKGARFLGHLLEKGMNENALLAHFKELEFIGMDFSWHNNGIRKLMFDLIKKGYANAVNTILTINRPIKHFGFFGNPNIESIHKWGYGDMSYRPGGHLTLLMFAIACEEQGIMQTLLHEGADINQLSHSKGILEHDICAETPLTLATKIKNVIAVKTLLHQHHADFSKNASDVNGEKRPFRHEDIPNGYSEVRIEATADVNLSNGNGETPLMCAVITGQQELAEILIKNKAKVNKRDNQKHLPIEIAISQNNVSMVKLLIKNGADLGLLTSTVETLRDFAARVANNELISLLVQTISSTQSETPTNITFSPKFFDEASNKELSNTTVTREEKLNNSEALTP